MFDPTSEFHISKYILRDKIGIGTFSSVFVAEHEKTKDRIAVKQVEKWRKTNNYDVKIELKILSIVQKHENIVQYLGHSYTYTSIYIGLELVKGGDLFSFLEKRKFAPPPEELARVIAKQLVSALSHCHSLGVAHRDIKLDNILITDDNKIKLIDFGLSTIFKKGELCSTQVGSPEYVSPQILTGRPYDPFQADVYALGVVFYSIIHGEFPYTLKEVRNLSRGIQVFRPYPRNYEHVCCDAKSLLKGMLAISPNHRLSISDVETHSWMSS